MGRVLLGVSGGIAAYKALDLVRLAIKAGHTVRVVQTERSLRFVGRASFEAITGAPVLCDEFERDETRGTFPGEPLPAHAPISHLALVERAEVYVIAPASANTLAKLAHGHADNLLTTAALAAACPVIVAPAMNHHMWEHPATRANLAQLAGRGVTVIGPESGSLASHGEHGVGRLSEPADILAQVEAVLASTERPPTSPFAGRRVLVTAGGTREPIDSVRYIGNRSSGRMGFALAARAAARGARVTVVAANVGLPAPDGVEVVPVTTAAELGAACERRFDSCDVLLMSAAVADFRPREAAPHKLKKQDGVPTLELEPTVDVLSRLSERRRAGQLVCGFAAEHGPEAVSLAREKLVRKHLDAIVVNDISRPDIGFDTAVNEVTVLTAAGGERTVPRMAKEGVADVILDELSVLWTDPRAAGDGAGTVAAR